MANFGEERGILESFPDEEGYKSLQTGRIKTRATVGTPDYVHKPEHIRNVMQGYTLGSLLSSGDRTDVFDIDYSPEALNLGIDNLDQRLQKLEGRTISDIDLDNMTKPAPKEEAPEPMSPMQPAEPMSPMQPDQQPQGIGAMQEPDMSMIPPEVLVALGNGIKNSAMQDPTMPQETKEQIMSLSDNNLGEMVGQIFEKAMEIPDEEVSSMSMEKEEEAEGIIDRLMGNGEYVPFMGDPKGGIRERLPSGDYLNSILVEAERRGDATYNHGGPVQQYNLGGIASMGRGGDSQLAHVMPGERMVPPGVVDDGMLDAAFVRAGLDPMEYKVGSPQASINPMTGMPEYGLFSFVKRLIKKVKKVAPIIGSMVGFAYGGPMGAGIGKAIGGVLKTGDLDFKDALTDFGTGWAMGNFATGMGMKGGVAKGQGMAGMKTIFQGADKGGIWGWGATPTIQHRVSPTDTSASIAGQYGVTEADIAAANPNNPYPSSGDIINVPKLDTSVGGFIQQAGAKVAAGLGGGPMPTDLATGKPYEFGLVEQFKNLPMGQKLGVGALGLAALSKTGMFDEEELGDVPPGIQTEMEGLQAYANQGLKPAIQGQWGVGSPTISTPAIPSHTSFYVPPTSQSSSLADALADLNKTNLRLPSPSFPA